MLRSESDNSLKGGGVVRSRLKELIAQKERDEGRSIQNSEIAAQSNLDANTISRWMKPTPFKKLETNALVSLCRYLNCQVGDLLYIDYSPN